MVEMTFFLDELHVVNRRDGTGVAIFALDEESTKDLIRRLQYRGATEVHRAPKLIAVSECRA